MFKRIFTGRPLYIALLVIFSLILCADLAVAALLPLSGGMGRYSGRDGSGFPEGFGSQVSGVPGGAGDGADGSAGEALPQPSGLPSGGFGNGSGDAPPSSDGSGDGAVSQPSDRPGGGSGDRSGMTPPFGGADGFSGGAMPDSPNGGVPGGSAMGAASGIFTFLQGVKSLWVPILVVCALADAFCVFMLVRIGRRRRSEAAAAQGGLSEGTQAPAPGAENGPARRKKRWILPLSLLALLVLAAAVPPAFSGQAVSAKSEASILGGTAAKGAIPATLSGSGTLTEQDAEPVTVPEGVEIASHAVTNGDAVHAGDALALVDRVSVMRTIASLQEKLDALDGRIESAEGQTISSRVTASVAGRVMLVHARKGVDVVDTMQEDGALLVVSLDGLMAVDIATDAALSAGDAVTVVLPGGSEESGRVASCVGGTAVVTLTDDGPEYGESVAVKEKSGAVLGNGALYVHSALKVTGFSGTVSEVAVKVGDEVDEGDTLLRLTNTEYAAEYDALVSKREALEDEMLTLFRLYQDGTLYAECDGIVSGIDEDDGTAVSAVRADTSAASYTILRLANAPNGDDSAEYFNYVGQVTKVSYGVLSVNLYPEAVSIPDYADLSGLNLGPGAMTLAGTLSPAESTALYTRSADNGWAAGSLGDIRGGDVLVFTYDSTAQDAELLWIVYAGHSDLEGSGGITGGGGGAEIGSGDAESGASGLAGGASATGGQSFGASSAAGSAAGAEEPAETYDVAETTVMAITPQQTMDVTITIDELDILALRVGQAAQVALDAIPGQAFDGTVKKIDTAGSNSGGNTKFAAVITLERTERMLGGMNASVVITLGVSDGVLTIPVAALNEGDGRTFVYTSYDERTGALGGPVEVTTGVSDGVNVEILSGLSDGDGYWYSYLDTINYATSAVSASGSGFPSVFRSRGRG